MVEWKRLEDVCDILTGGDVPKNCIKGQTFPSDSHPYAVYSNGDGVYGYSINYRINKDAVTISSIGNVGSVNYRSAFFTPVIRLKVVIPSHPFLQTKYLYYILSCYKFVGTNSSLSSMKAADIKRIQIPIPPSSDQSWIVEILDTFTSSIENLKEQIMQRRKQYEYYRDRLLDLEGKEGVEMQKLGDIAKVLRGKRLTKDLLDDSLPYPVFHGGVEPLGKYGQYNREANTVMVINVGASAGTVGYCDCKFWSSDGCFCISHSNLFNNKYLFYYLETKTHYLQSQVRHAGIPTLDNPVVEKIMIPLIPLQEQSRIVSILDTFEASIQNLEAQLKQREKQYEYYRNKLLTFE